MVILPANAINSQIVLLNSFMKTHLFMVELGLHFCSRAFSSCCNWGVTLCSGSQTSHCSGFACCREQAAEHLGFNRWGLGVLEHGLSSCGAQA